MELEKLKNIHEQILLCLKQKSIGIKYNEGIKQKMGQYDPQENKIVLYKQEDMLTEIILIAHEYGHYKLYSYPCVIQFLRYIGNARIKYNENKEGINDTFIVLSDEIMAWILGAKFLKQFKFRSWIKYSLFAARCLMTYLKI